MGYCQSRELIRLGTVSELLGENADFEPLSEELAKAHYEEDREGNVRTNQITGSVLLTISEKGTKDGEAEKDLC